MTKSGFFSSTEGFARVVGTMMRTTWVVNTPCRTRIFFTHIPYVTYKHRVHA